MRPGLRAQRRAAGGGGGGPLERLRLRRHERDPRVPPLPGLTADDPLAALEDRLGHRFLVPDLLRQALTHPSWAHEHPPARHNEGLAFLGDAVLGLVVADLLRAAAPDEGTGALTQRRAELVSGRALADWAQRLDLSAALRLGRGEDRSGGRARDSILASALEAVLAALYLDGGLDPIRALVRGQAFHS